MCVGGCTGKISTISRAIDHARSTARIPYLLFLSFLFVAIFVTIRSSSSNLSWLFGLVTKSNKQIVHNGTHTTMVFLIFFFLGEMVFLKFGPKLIKDEKRCLRVKKNFNYAQAQLAVFFNFLNTI